MKIDAPPDSCNRTIAGAFDGSSPSPMPADTDVDHPPAPAARWVPFPVRTLPPALGRYVADVARARQCDPAAVALPLLAGLAGAIGNARVARLGADWFAPAVLWAAVVAPSGAVKSPGFHAALAPLERIDRAEREAWKALKADYDAEQLAYEVALSDWKRSKNRGEPPVPPVEPKLPRIIAEDVTLQALAGLLDANTRGVLLARDELSGWVRSFDQFTASAGADLARWLEIHRAGPLRVDRKSDGHVFVPRAAVSVAGTIQTGILPEVFGGQEQAAGLLARFLLANPPEPSRSWAAIRTARAPDVGALVALFESLRRLPMAKDGDAEVAHVLELSDEAAEAYGGWFDQHEQRRHDTEAGSWRSALSKLEELPGRLSLVLALATASHPQDLEEIEGDAMRRSLALADWFRDEGQRVYAVMSEGPEERADRELVEWCREHPDAAAREVAQALHRYRGRGATAQAEADLLRLVAAGLLEKSERKPKRGPSTTTYRTPEPPPAPTGFDDSQREEAKPVGVGAVGDRWETEL